MILVDTSVWIDHLRRDDAALVRLLEGGEVITHPYVIGELALGNLVQRERVLRAMRRLPRADVVSDVEVLHLVGAKTLFGRGIGYVDAHLLASAMLTPDTHLWTRDKPLHAVAVQLGLVTGEAA